MGRRIGASQRAITYYETDGKYPPAPVVADLAAALGVTMEALMGRDDIPEPGHASGLNLLGDPDDRRLWKKFRQLRNLSDRDQAYVFKTLTMIVETKGADRSA